jgi:radical SAM protein with 4Fe4S-binding SPASM domain
MEVEGPLMIGWDITNACNLKCIHCYANSGKPEENELTTGEVKQIIDQAKQLGTILISFSGGEPLLRRDIFKVIEYTKKMGIVAFLNTNGTLLNQEIAKKLKKLKIDGIEISLDGVKAKTHDKIRGVKGSFEKTIEGLKLCINTKLPVGVLTTANKINLHEIPRLIDFVYSMGAIGIGILRFKPIGRGRRVKRLELTPEERKKLLLKVFKKRVEIEKKNSNFAIKAETPVSILIAMKFPYLMKKYSYVNFMERGCPGGRVSCNIRPNGDVSSCAQMPLVVGNLRKKSLEELWKNSDMFTKLRNRKNLKGKCHSCRYINICGGCRTSAYIHKGDYLEEDPGCWL